MVSAVIILAASCLTLASAAPQLRAAFAPAPYQRNLGLPALSYPAPAVLPYQAPVVASGNLPLSRAYYQPALSARRSAAILSQSQDLNFDGSYSYGFQSEDGTSVQSSGAQKALGPELPGQVSSGTFSYVAPDGSPIVTSWYADETGFHAEGDHLPKGPEGHIRSL